VCYGVTKVLHFLPFPFLHFAFYLSIFIHLRFGGIASSAFSESGMEGIEGITHGLARMDHRTLDRI